MRADELRHFPFVWLATVIVKMNFNKNKLKSGLKYARKSQFH